MTIDKDSHGNADPQVEQSLAEGKAPREHGEDRLRAELGALRSQIESAAKRHEELKNQLRGFSARLASVSEGEVFRDVLQQAVAGIKRVAEEQLTSTREESRQKIEQSVQQATAQVTQAMSRVETLLQELRAESDELQLTAEERRRFYREFKPGTIDEQNQRIAALRQRIKELEDECLELKNERAEKILALKRLQSSPEHLSKEQLDARSKALDELQARLESAEKLQVERDALQKRLDELSSLRMVYERNQQVSRADADLRIANEKLKQDLDQLRVDKDDLRAQLDRLQRGLDHRDKLLSESRRTQAEQAKFLEELRTRLADTEKSRQALEATVEAEKKRYEAKVEELRVEQAELKKERKRLEDEEQAALKQQRADRERFEASMQDRKRDLDAERRVLEEVLQKRIEGQHANRLTQLERELTAAQSGNKQMEKLKERLESDLVQAQKERADFLVNKAALEAEARRTRQEMEACEERFTELKDQLAELEPRIQALKTTKAELEAQIKAMEADYAERRKREQAQVDAIIERRKQLEERTIDRPKRLEPIVRPWEPPAQHSMVEHRDEGRWLQGVEERIAKTGFQFPRRLLKAFHTSLKIASWAPLTALAGVSGTGKSELPRLYAYCGGLRFLSVPVQPNWDSPQDLFGFFNYMDGRFRATDLVRAMYQSQLQPSEGGFNNGLLLVLLDEMNRARFELYFSELLSRLESRRGAGSVDEQSVQVDLGAGVDPLRLRLGENVLFVGTMNEDESTHSLSDMVLDRGNVLSFPRPKRLKRREARQPIERLGQMLPHETWKAWIHEPGKLPDEARLAIDDALTQINDALAYVGRAIGHRVLQAIESYVANYPGALGSETLWKMALEDQLAQKIMPKLRGIELGSKAGDECLDAVSHVLQKHAPALGRDFARSRERSQGAFIWSSATYLEEEGQE